MCSVVLFFVFAFSERKNENRTWNCLSAQEASRTMNSTADASGAEDRMNPAKATRRARRRRRLLPYALALPIVLYEIVMIVYPIAQGIYGSFQQIELAADSPPTWVGLANYQRMLI